MKNILWGCVILLVMAFAGYFFGHIIIYVVIAAIFSLIAQPLDDWLGKVKIGRLSFSPTISAALTILAIFLFFFLLGNFFTPLIMEEAKIISGLDPVTILRSLDKPVAYIESLFREYNFEFAVADVRLYIKDKLSAMLTATNISNLINNLVVILGDFIIAFFSIIFLTFFFLRDRKILLDSVLSIFFLKKYAKQLRVVVNESETLLKRYFIGIVTEMLIMFTLISIGLWIAGVKQGLLIALFAAIINVIPYVGPIIGGIFALTIGFTTQTDMDAWGLLWRVFTVFSVANFVDVFLLQPLIYSSSVKAHPAEIFVVILMGAAIGGIPGMILAVPSYTILRVIVREFFDKGPA